MKVGDYVRIDGYISKIEHIKTSSSDKTYVQWKQPNGMLASANIIIIDEFSPKIIDLIEVGDIVNYGLIGGGMVLHKENDKIATNTLLFGILKNEDIKSVITKEQLKNCMYEVGDSDER